MNLILLGTMIPVSLQMGVSMKTSENMRWYRYEDVFYNVRSGFLHDHLDSEMESSKGGMLIGNKRICSDMEWLARNLPMKSKCI